MTSAFEPPAEEDQPRSSAVTSVLTAWMTSGALMGLAGGLTAQLVGSSLARPLPVVLFAGMSIAGGVAWTVERRWAERRPAILDARGRMERPPHTVLYALPLALAVPALLGLLVVGTVAMRSMVPAMVFGVGGFGLGWACRRLFASHRITEALQALELGDRALAVRRLEDLETSWMSTRRGRTTARLNLGMLALSNGELDRASRFYEQVDDPSGSSFAKAGLALVRVLQERLVDAEVIVLETLSGPGAEAVQGQLDAVRMLLTLRQDGAAAATQLGTSLEGQTDGELFRGLLALSHLRVGAVAAARTIADDHLLVALEESGWRTVIPEIAELLVQPELG